MPKVVEPKKKAAEVKKATKERPSEQAMREAKEISKKPKKKGSPISARDLVLRVLEQGAPKSEVKARARKLAEEEGVDVSFKTFDVSFFIRHMTEKKNYTLSLKKSGVVKLIAPK